LCFLQQLDSFPFQQQTILCISSTNHLFVNHVDRECVDSVHFQSSIPVHTRITNLSPEHEEPMLHILQDSRCDIPDVLTLSECWDHFHHECPKVVWPCNLFHFVSFHVLSHGTETLC
jgi:hypothetical protein